MANVTVLPEIVQSIHGSLSKNSPYYFKTVNGQIKMYQKSDRCHQAKPTQAQMAYQQKFKLAQSLIKALLGSDLCKRWMNQLWHEHGRQYKTARGWMMAQIMKL